MKTIGKSALFLLLAALLALSGANPAAAQSISPAGADQTAAWTQLASLTASDGAASDNLGKTVTMSADGLIVAAGAPNKTVGANAYQGAVYVFIKPAGGWANATSAIRLTASDGADSDYFGSAIAISGDGSTIVVGAGSKQVSNVLGPGEVYVFARPAGGWASATETARLTPLAGVNAERFGASVGTSTDGSSIAVGASGKQIGANQYQGQVYVFVKPNSSGWVSGHETAHLTVSGGAAYDFLGRSIAMSGDGKTIVSGADGAGGDVGAAFVFVKPTSGSWVNGTQQARLTGSDGTDSDFMGAAVAISTDGTTVAVGAPDKPVGTSYFFGAAYVFVKPSGAWANATQTARLNTSNLAQYDHLGQSVAVNANGSMVAAGAPRQLTTYSAGQGSAYLFTKPAGNWANSTQSAEVSVSGTAVHDDLGASVATNGTITVSGAPARPVGTNAAQGAVYVFSAGLAAPTTTTLTSNPNYSWLGASVTFTATIHPASGSGTPTGKVVFNVDGVNKPAVTLASGSATYTTSSLTVGPHTVTATYTGDANFAGSVSNALVQRVAKYKTLFPRAIK